MKRFFLYLMALAFASSLSFAGTSILTNSGTGWTLYAGDGNAFATTTNGTTCSINGNGGSGNYYYMYYAEAGPASHYSGVDSPLLGGTGYHKLLVSFYTNSPSCSQVDYPVTVTNLTSSEVWTGSNVGNESWIQQNVIIDGGSDFSIRIMDHGDNSTSDEWMLDDISITGYAFSVGTTSASSVASCSATINCTFSDNGLGSDIGSSFTRGVCYMTGSGVPTTANTTSTTTSGTTDFSVGLTGLNSLQTYSARAYVIIDGDTYYGNTIEFTTLSATVTVSAVTSSSLCNGDATFNGNVTSDGGSAITARGFVYSSVDATPTLAEVNGTTVWTSGNVGGTTGAYTYGATGLTGGTTYYYNAWASNNCGTIETSNNISFTAVNDADMTATTPTYVHQLANGDYRATDYTTLMLEGNCTNTRGEGLNARGFYYSINATNSDPDGGEGGVTTVTNASGAENTYGTGAFTDNITGLASGTYYAFKSWGTHTNCVDEGVSSVQNFWTLANATLSTPGATEITHNSIDFTTSFANAGSSTVTEYGVVYARRELIDAGHIGTAAYFPIIGGTDCIKIAFWNGSQSATSGNTTMTVGGDNFVARNYTDGNTANPFLYSNTVYYVRPYVKNNAGTFYGTTQSVLTEDVPYIDNAAIGLNNEVTGGDWEDPNGNNADPTIYGPPTTNAPDLTLSEYVSASNDTWRSWSFDGSNGDYFTLPYNSNSGRLNQNTAKALFMYFQTAGTNVANRQVLLELAGSNSGMNVYIYYNKLWVGMWNSSQRRFFSKTIESGENYLLNVEYNGTKVRTALNGVCSSSMLFSGFAANSNMNGIGASTNGTRYMDLTRGTGTYDYYTGKIADILLYNDCSQSLRTAMMNFFDQKYGQTFRSAYTYYFGKALAEAGWDEYTADVSPFDNNDGENYSKFEVYQSSKDLSINLFSDESDMAEIAIFDMNGIKIGEIHNGKINKGDNNFKYSTNDIISGTYFIRAIGLGLNESAKINIVK